MGHKRYIELVIKIHGRSYSHNGSGGRKARKSPTPCIQVHYPNMDRMSVKWFLVPFATVATL